MNSNTSPEDSLLTIVNMLTSVNSTCERNVRESRVVGFRVSKLAWILYQEALADADKDSLKAINEALIYAMAKHRLGKLPCEDYVNKRLEYAVNLVGPKSMNINVNIVANNNNNNVTVNVKETDINEIIQLLDYLYGLAEDRLSLSTKRVLKTRISKAKSKLLRLIDPTN